MSRPLGVIFLTGVRSRLLDEAGRLAVASADTAIDQMPLGVLVTPATSRYTEPSSFAPDVSAPEIYPWAGIDNGCFTPEGRACYTEDGYLALIEHTLEVWGSDYVLFATARDMPFDPAKPLPTWYWEETLRRSLPVLPVLRRAGVPAAIVIQDGATVENVPWSECDAIFIGGSDDYKLGDQAREIVAEATRRHMWSHMGRVNSLKRIRIAQSFGCGSADGTFLARAGGPEGVRQVLHWATTMRQEDPRAESVAIELMNQHAAALGEPPVAFASQLASARQEEQARAVIHPESMPAWKATLLAHAFGPKVLAPPGEAGAASREAVRNKIDAAHRAKDRENAQRARERPPLLPAPVIPQSLLDTTEPRDQLKSTFTALGKVSDLRPYGYQVVVWGNPRTGQQIYEYVPQPGDSRAYQEPGARVTVSNQADQRLFHEAIGAPLPDPANRAKAEERRAKREAEYEAWRAGYDRLEAERQAAEARHRAVAAEAERIARLAGFHHGTTPSSKHPHHATPSPRHALEAQTEWHGGGGHWDPEKGHVEHKLVRTHGTPHRPADEPLWHPGGGHLDPASGHVPHRQVRLHPSQVRLHNPSWAVEPTLAELEEMERREDEFEREERLDNPAKTPRSLRIENRIVLSHGPAEGSVWGELISLTIYTLPGQGFAGSDKLARVEALRREGDSAYRVQSAGAVHGWGPLAYDVVMEKATELGSALAPDRTSVTPEARAVWGHYATRRDVWIAEPSSDPRFPGDAEYRKHLTTLAALRKKSLFSETGTRLDNPVPGEWLLHYPKTLISAIARSEKLLGVEVADRGAYGLGGEGIAYPLKDGRVLKVTRDPKEVDLVNAAIRDGVFDGFVRVTAGPVKVGKLWAYAREPITPFFVEGVENDRELDIDDGLNQLSVKSDSAYRSAVLNVSDLVPEISAFLGRLDSSQGLSVGDAAGNVGWRSDGTVVLFDGRAWPIGAGVRASQGEEERHDNPTPANPEAEAAMFARSREVLAFLESLGPDQLVHGVRAPEAAARLRESIELSELRRAEQIERPGQGGHLRYDRRDNPPRRPRYDSQGKEIWLGTDPPALPIRHHRGPLARSYDKYKPETRRREQQEYRDAHPFAFLGKTETDDYAVEEPLLDLATLERLVADFRRRRDSVAYMITHRPSKRSEVWIVDPHDDEWVREGDTLSDRAAEAAYPEEGIRQVRR